jgi:hypothetical protein
LRDAANSSGSPALPDEVNNEENEYSSSMIYIYILIPTEALVV